MLDHLPEFSQTPFGGFAENAVDAFAGADQEGWRNEKGKGERASMRGDKGLVDW